MKNIDLQNQIIENEGPARDQAAKWWTPLNGGGARLYLNPPSWVGTKYAKSYKVWLSFADAQTLAGAVLHVKINIGQHPNWIVAEETKWRENFSDVLEQIAELRADAGLDGQQNEEAIEIKKSVDAAIRESIADEHREFRAQAQLDIEIKRVDASSVSEIKNEFGDVDTRIPLPAHFREVSFSENELRESGVEFARAMKGFKKVNYHRPARRGGSYEKSEPQFGGFIVATDDIPKIKTSEEIAAEKAAARKQAKKDAALAAGFATVADFDRHTKAEAEKAAAAQKASWEKQYQELRGQFFAGQTQTGNIVVRDGRGLQFCLVTSGAQAGKWVAGASFPLHIASHKIESATCAREAADLFANSLTSVRHDGIGWAGLENSATT